MSSEISNGQSSVRLKYLAAIEMGQSPSSSEYTSEDNGLPFLQGCAEFGDKYPTPKVYCAEPSKLANEGDILFSVRAPVGDLNIADQVVGIGRGLCAIRAEQQLDDKFLWWVLHDIRGQLRLVETGSTYAAVSTEDVANLLVPEIELLNQQEIANYLDRETAHIDNLVRAKENLLTMLAEKRQAIITQAVTRGLNPSVPMKPSGVDWLGDVPEHWEVKRAKWLFRERDVRTQTGEETLLSLRMERGLVPHNEVSEKPVTDSDLIGYKVTLANDLVINKMRASGGLVAVTPFLGLVSPDYSVFETVFEISPEYYMELFKTNIFKTIFRSVSKGLGTGSSGFLRMYTENFYTVSMPVPPFAEQLEIIEYIEREKTRLNALHSVTEQTISLLKERRSALITAAVTGQIEIAHHVG